MRKMAFYKGFGRFFENQGENKVYGSVCQIKLCMSSHFMANAPTGIRNQ